MSYNTDTWTNAVSSDDVIQHRHMDQCNQSERKKKGRKMSVKIYLIASLMRFEITMETELWVCVWRLPGLG